MFLPVTDYIKDLLHHIQIEASIALPLTVFAFVCVIIARGPHTQQRTNVKVVALLLALTSGLLTFKQLLVHVLGL